MRNIVEIKEVFKTIDKEEILSGINLQIAEGEIYGFLGPNGAGKTTLMRCIAGFAKPTKGKVVVDGCIVGKDIDFPDKMGVIIENPGFLPSYNAFFNLKILSRVSGKAADEHIRKVITEMGLDPDNLKPVGQYSLGMRGRLGIAQAIMENPDYLILDEPFNGLDQDGVEDVHQLLQKLKKEGKCILLASHSATDISKACDEVYKIKEGKICRS